MHLLVLHQFKQKVFIASQFNLLLILLPILKIHFNSTIPSTSRFPSDGFLLDFKTKMLNNLLTPPPLFYHPNNIW